MLFRSGLGAAATVDKLEIKWPGGQLETVSIPGVDRKLTVTQGKGITSR